MVHRGMARQPEVPSDNLHLGGGVPVTGFIPVEAEDLPALGFIYGTVASVASGYLQFLWGNFGTRLLLGPGKTATHLDYDLLEYRFEPDWWLTVVADRLQLEAMG
jgi:hypothetical protein